ncbi:MAG: protein-tyrosine-phosphatase [Planctomyces sp.]|nr:protein-tyrosine-phosphatase [Planctomyces sp.]
MRLLTVIAVIATCIPASQVQPSTGRLFPEIEQYVARRSGEFDRIPEHRRKTLEELAAVVKSRVSRGETATLTFICTHNSRRSHFAQIWARIAAVHYGVKPVETYSGGTEATAMNPRTIAALKRSGIKVSTVEESDIEKSIAEKASKNPHYSVAFSDEEMPLDCYSKVFNQSPNPSTGFIAIMTCSQADRACPVVDGCEHRVSVPFEDPKVADGTAIEAAAYDERCAQIATEMLYMMSRVSN